MIPDRARLAYICRRFFFDFAPPGVRAGLISRFGKSWHHFCPVCEEPVGGYAPLANLYFEQLAAHGSDLRIPDFETCNFENYQCAHCGSTDRDRLYALYLAQRLPASAEAQAQFSLLDIAPGAALSAHIRRKYRLRYRTADLFQKNVDDRVDVTSMTCYSDGMFDAFICSHVLEHVSDDSKAMRELRRILKPGGWGIAMVPVNTKLREVREDPTEKDEGQRWKRFGQGDHLRVYSPEGFVNRLESAGFRVLKLGKDKFGPEKMERCGLSPGSVLYIVEKN